MASIMMLPIISEYTWQGSGAAQPISTRGSQAAGAGVVRRQGSQVPGTLCPRAGRSSRGGDGPAHALHPQPSCALCRRCGCGAPCRRCRSRSWWARQRSSGRLQAGCDRCRWVTGDRTEQEGCGSEHRGTGCGGHALLPGMPVARALPDAQPPGLHTVNGFGYAHHRRLDAVLQKVLCVRSTKGGSGVE